MIPRAFVKVTLTCNRTLPRLSSYRAEAVRGRDSRTITTFQKSNLNITEEDVEEEEEEEEVVEVEEA